MKALPLVVQYILYMSLGLLTDVNAQPPRQPHYLYRIKIINPIRKEYIIVRELRRFPGRFNSITELKVRLIEKLEESVPRTTKFAVGYFVQLTKHWICNEEDLNALHTACDNQIMLWCDGYEDECHIESTPSQNSKRQKGEEHVTKHKEKEQHVEDLAKELQEQYEDKLQLSDTQYRLWARMIEAGIHARKDMPPQVPLITGVTPKRMHANTFKDTIMHTATAIMKAIT